MRPPTERAAVAEVVCPNPRPAGCDWKSHRRSHCRRSDRSRRTRDCVRPTEAMDRGARTSRPTAAAPAEDTSPPARAARFRWLAAAKASRSGVKSRALGIVEEVAGVVGRQGGARIAQPLGGGGRDIDRPHLGTTWVCRNRRASALWRAARPLLKRRRAERTRLTDAACPPASSRTPCRSHRSSGPRPRPPASEAPRPVIVRCWPWSARQPRVRTGTSRRVAVDTPFR